jgi:glucose-1-phosphate adenylyltransferase
VLTQYKSHSLDRHVSQTWRMSALLNSYVASVPAQQRLGKRWFSGSADAILQSLNLIHDEKPDIVVVIGADHVYRMDFEQMLAAHIESGAKATVAGIRQPIGLANQFGVIDLDPSDNVTIREFLEKPQNPTGLADAPHEVLASMGNYIFDADALIAAVEADGELPGSNHDMGGDIIPYFVGRGEAAVYDFKRNDVPGSTDRDRDYWRDVGTIDSFFDAHMDLISTLPIFNLYNVDWPIHSQSVNSPPAKFVRDGVGRMGNAIDSIVSLGSVLSGTHLERSVVGPWTLSGGGRRSPTPCSSTTSRSAPARGCIARSSTRTSSWSRGDGRRGPRLRSRARVHRDRQRHHGGRKERLRRALTADRLDGCLTPASSSCSTPIPPCCATKSSSSSPTRRAAVPKSRRPPRRRCAVRWISRRVCALAWRRCAALR